MVSMALPRNTLDEASPMRNLGNVKRIEKSSARNSRSLSPPVSRRDRRGKGEGSGRLLDAPRELGADARDLVAVRVELGG
jgi:hypothetical protein